MFKTFYEFGKSIDTVKIVFTPPWRRWEKNLWRSRTSSVVVDFQQKNPIDHKQFFEMNGNTKHILQNDLQLFTMIEDNISVGQRPNSKKPKM